MNAQIVGTRAADWTTGKAPGSEIFRLLSGADHLKLQNMNFANVGNGAFRIGADIEDLTLEHMQATNVQRFIENSISGDNSSASVDGLTVRDVHINKYAEFGIKLAYNSRNIVIEDTTGVGDPNTPEKYVSGVSLNHTVHDVLIKNVTMANSNARGSGSEYWNGDGFLTEANTYNIRFENTVASGNTDAGYDLKSSNTVLVNAIAENNNRSYKLWSDSISLENSQSLNPTHFGGSASTSHVYLADGAQVKMTGGSILDHNSSLRVFDLWKADTKLEVNGTVIDTEGRLSGLGTNSQLIFGYKTVNGTLGNDKLSGTSSNDKIDGTSGNDTLWGKGGGDILTGGTGKDAFTFDTKLGAGNVDTITDFSVVDDTVHLNHTVFTKLTSGTLSSSNFVVGDKALDSKDYIIYNNKTGALSYDADGSGSGAAIQFAKVDASLKMTAADFVVI